jgi:triosephosphate isomerase
MKDDPFSLENRAPMRIPFVAGNWKMNLERAGAEMLAADVVNRIKQVPGITVAVCPPFPYLSAVHAKLAGSSVQLGAQNIYCEPKGAFTGEVSASMALDCGCTWVILGHSERRIIIGEGDALINKKIRAALAAGLHVILCVGEILEQRQKKQSEKVVEAQLQGSLDGIDVDPTKLVIAYEPVWAIGTGVVAKPEQAEAMHQFIRQWFSGKAATTAESLRIQYGGSVTPANAASLMAQANVDGLLVGGASLKAEDFAAIVKAAARS